MIDFVDLLSVVQVIHDDYMKKLTEITKLQGSCSKAVKHQHYILRNFRETLSKFVVI